MKVAVVQTRWADDPGTGLHSAYEALARATSGGDVDVVCFPEFLLGPPWYMPGQDRLRGVTDTPIPSPIIERFQSIAHESKTYVVLGTVVEDLRDGKYRNTSLLIDRSGNIAGQAVKAHAFGNEMVVCRQAESIGVLETDCGTIAVAVCSDFWIPEVIRMQALAGARTILVPGGTLRQNQALLTNALSSAAYLNDVNIVYASSVGVVHGMRGGRPVEIHFAGTSLVTTPDGVLAQASHDTPEILTVDLNEPDGSPEPGEGDGGIWRRMRHPESYAPLLETYVGACRDLAAELRSNLAARPNQDASDPAHATDTHSEGIRS
jgi:predicted amidohydrolase